ncbi:hypothetical protein Tco_0489264 [Tanacetum coccineum]
MAALKYRDEHNKVGYLEKPKGSDDYHQVLDFLRGSHLRYALTHDPIIFDSLVKQFWSTASLRAPELGPPAILATIDRTPYTITEDTVRSQLQLGDDGGIEDLPIADIYLGMDNLGYPTEGKLTFHKNKFSPQWRFLVHTIQHCLSTKSGSWDQFGSPLAIALICLSDGRRFNWSSYIFKGMVNNISNAKRYGVAVQMSPQTIPETIQETRPEPDQSQEHIPTPPRPTTSDQIPPVFEQGHTSDPNIASFSGAMSLILTFSLLQMWKMKHLSKDLSTPFLLGPLKFPLLRHIKLLFKDVVGKLVKKVKALELKLKPRSRKVVMSESDKEEEEEQDVDPLIKLAKAVAASDAHVDVSPGADIPPSPPLPIDMSAGVSSSVSTGTPVVHPYKGQISYHGHLHANQGLTSDLLGPDVNEDNFAERMVALIVERKRVFVAQRFQEKRNKPMTYAQQKAYMRTFVKNQSTTIYTTGWTMKHVKSLSNEQLKSEFEKIRTAVADLQSQNIRRTLNRVGEDLEHDVSKKPKPTEVPMLSQPNVPQQQATNVPPVDPQQPSESSLQPNVSMSSGPKKKGHTYGTRRKSLGTRKKSSTTLDLDANDRSFIRVLSDDDSDNDDDPVIVWSAFTTALSLINAFYKKDNSRKCFTSLREILHLVTRADLMTIYGRVMTFYQDKKAAGVGLVLWGDLKLLMDSPEVNDGSDVFSGLILHMFVDKKYPLSINLIERMLDHQLEICHGTVGNELTTAVQLIAFLKKQISDSRRPKVHDCSRLDAEFHVADSVFIKVAFGVGFKMLLFNPLVFSTKDLSRNLKLTVSNSSLGEDC